MHRVPTGTPGPAAALVGAAAAALLQGAAWAAPLPEAPAAAPAFPVVGGYGFDWLQPTTTRCRRISPAEAAAFRGCRFFPAGQAFGLPTPHHACVAPGRSELLIYASPARCAEAFETMQANGP